MMVFKNKKNMTVVVFVIFCLVLGIAALASAGRTGILNSESLFVYGDKQNPETKIIPKIISGENTFVMPSNCSPDEVYMYMEIPENATVKVSGNGGECEFKNGEPVNLDKICSNGNYHVKIIASADYGSDEHSVRFMFSENVSAVYIKSDDVFFKNRRWVESSSDKSNKATGTMVMQNSDGETVYNGSLTQIKGRGNTTWELPKKPYQIKLGEKIDLLETGNEKNKSKTWVLLANYIDSSLLRNTLALDLGKKAGMKTNIESRHVDLYYDGEYRGSYLLTEKVEVAPGRVDVSNLEDENQNCNPGVDFETLDINTDTTLNGATYTYCEGMVSPEDITGGYLIEMDFENRALEEICYFKTKRGQYVVVKSPEYASKEEMDYIASLYQDYENAVYEGGINPDTGKDYSQYVDADSVAQYVLINELSKSVDCFKSSAYLYKDKGTDYLTMGPLWDYDMSFGRGGSDYNEFDSTYGIINIYTDFAMKLFKIESFYDTLKSVYNDAVYPYINEYLFAPSDSGNFAYSLESQIANIKETAMCNTALWYSNTDFAVETIMLKDFILVRSKVLKEILNSLETLNPIADNRYLDVIPSDWFFNDVTQASKLGYVNGIGNYCFEPRLNVKRSQIIQIIYNISQSGSVNFKYMFRDVGQNDWFAPAVTWAADNNICIWGQDGYFKPDEYATRGEVVNCLYKYSKADNLGVPGSLDKFADKSEIPQDEFAAFEWAVSVNLVSGYEDGAIKPKDFISRGELCAILVRYSNLTV